MSQVNDLANFVYIADTTAVSGQFVALLAVETAALHADSVCRSSPSTLTGMPIPAGTMLYGLFTTVKLSSGKVLAYTS